MSTHSIPFYEETRNSISCVLIWYPNSGTKNETDRWTKRKQYNTPPPPPTHTHPPPPHTHIHKQKLGGGWGWGGGIIKKLIFRIFLLSGAMNSWGPMMIHYLSLQCFHPRENDTDWPNEGIIDNQPTVMKNNARLTILFSDSVAITIILCTKFTQNIWMHSLLTISALKFEHLYVKCPQVLNTKVSDKMPYANNADPDQSALEGAIWSGSSLFAIPLSILGDKCIKSKI